MALRCVRSEDGSSPSVGTNYRRALGRGPVSKTEISGFDSCRRCQSIWTFTMHAALVIRTDTCESDTNFEAKVRKHGRTRGGPGLLNAMLHQLGLTKKDLGER
jgi:hypothetical protein